MSAEFSHLTPEQQSPRLNPEYWSGHAVEDDCEATVYPEVVDEDSIIGAAWGIVNDYLQRTENDEEEKVGAHFLEGRVFDSSRYNAGTVVSIDAEWVLRDDVSRPKTAVLSSARERFWGAILPTDLEDKESEHLIVTFPQVTVPPGEVLPEDAFFLNEERPTFFLGEFTVGDIWHDNSMEGLSAIRRTKGVYIHETHPRDMDREENNEEVRIVYNSSPLWVPVIA